MINGLDAVSRRLGYVRGTGSRAVELVLLLAALSACGPLEEAPVEDTLDTRARELMSRQGLSLNGLSLNGLSLNGLSLNGLSTAQFNDWFQENPTLHNQVMKYVVLCAVPAGETRTYTSGTGMSWSWPGSLGLAPAWSQGSPPSLTEQRVISACLAAHANRFGVEIALSVQGVGATGVPIPLGSGELQTYAEKEGCFFGNVFNAQEGLYAGNDGRPLNRRESTARACALHMKWPSSQQDCPPMMRIEPNCSEICTPSASGTYYTSCTYNGIVYPTITTRILPEDIYMCGDGVCQVSEKCGTGTNFDNCQLDCGACP